MGDDPDGFLPHPPEPNSCMMAFDHLIRIADRLAKVAHASL